MDELVQDNIRAQEEFDEYLKFLPQRVPCKFMISTVVNLCTRPDLKCPYRGEEIYSFAHGPKKECKRTDIIHYKEILGVK